MGEGLLRVEGQGLLVGSQRRVGEAEHQRASGVVSHAAPAVHVLAMDVAVEDGHVLEGRQGRHHRVAIAGEPLPFGLEIE